MDFIYDLYYENPNIFKKQYALIRATSMVEMVNTMSLTFTWLTLDLFTEEYKMKFTEQMKSSFLTCIPHGAVLGCLTGCVGLNFFGRLNTLFFCSLFSTALFTIMSFEEKPELIIEVRLMQGVCLGIQATAAAVYAGETILGKYKPLANIGRTSCGGTGILFLVIARYYGIGWRGMARVIAMISSSAGLHFLVLPYSPYRMYREYGREKCMTALRWILRDQADCDRQFNQLKNICVREEERSVTVFDVFTNFRDNYLALLMIVLQQLTGVIIIRFYSAHLLARLVSSVSTLTCVSILASLDALFYMSSSLQHQYSLQNIAKKTGHFFPRVLFALGIYFAFTDIIGYDHFAHYTSGVLSTYALTSLACFVGAFNLGWGKLSEEYLLANLGVMKKEMVCGVILAVKWAIAFILCKSFPFMFYRVGFGVVFVILGIIYSMLHNFSMPKIEENNVQPVDLLY